MEKELELFLKDWVTDNNNMKPLFTSLLEYANGLGGMRFEYKGRPGVSHSVRLINPKQNSRPFFGLLDIIDDDPDSRWISACFYAEAISDPEEKGDLIPKGLEGDKDAICFDVEDPEDFAEYLKERIKEGYSSL